MRALRAPARADLPSPHARRPDATLAAAPGRSRVAPTSRPRTCARTQRRASMNSCSRCQRAIWRITDDAAAVHARGRAAGLSVIRRRDTLHAVATAVVVVIFTVQREGLSVLLIERAAEPCGGSGRCPAVFCSKAKHSTARRRESWQTRPASQMCSSNSSTRSTTSAGPGGHRRRLLRARRCARTRLRSELEWRPAWHPVRGMPSLAFENERILAVRRGAAAQQA